MTWRRKATPAFAALGLALTVAVLAVNAWAGTTITVTPTCAPPHGCSFAPKDYSIGVGENPVLSIPGNADKYQFHDVVAKRKGADGRPLFASALTGPGKAAVVDGTQYLQPGVYPFICTIHADLNTPMVGTLVVTDNGTAPPARPTVDVRLPAQSLKRVLRRRSVRVIVTAGQTGNAVGLTVEIRGKRLGRLSIPDLEAGVPRTVEVAVKGAGRADLEKAQSAVISAKGSIRFGIPDTARRKVR